LINHKCRLRWNQFGNKDSNQKLKPLNQKINFQEQDPHLEGRSLLSNHFLFFESPG
jgi:hypothetical protein